MKQENLHNIISPVARSGLQGGSVILLSGIRGGTTFQEDAGHFSKLWTCYSKSKISNQLFSQLLFYSQLHGLVMQRLWSYLESLNIVQWTTPLIRGKCIRGELLLEFLGLDNLLFNMSARFLCESYQINLQPQMTLSFYNGPSSPPFVGLGRGFDKVLALPSWDSTAVLVNTQLMPQ